MRNDLSKMLSRLNSPLPLYPPHRVELLGAESLLSPTLTGSPARGSSDRPTCEKYFIRVFQLFSSRVGRIFLDCTRHSLVLVLSLFYNVMKLLFSFITLPDVWNSLISRYLLAGCRLHLGFLEKLVLNLRVIFQSAYRIKSLFPYKDMINRSQLSKVVYKISRWDFHIGKAQRRLHDRKTEHFKAITSSCHISAIADHVMSTGHNLKWDHFDIPAKDRSNSISHSR